MREGNSVYCHKCGHEAGNDDVFCGNCGAKLIREDSAQATDYAAGQSNEPVGSADEVEASTLAPENPQESPDCAQSASDITGSRDGTTTWNPDDAETAYAHPSDAEKAAHETKAAVSEKMYETAAKTPSQAPINAVPATASGSFESAAYTGGHASASAAKASKSFSQKVKDYYSGPKKKERLVISALIAVAAIVLIVVGMSTCTWEQMSVADQAFRSSDKLTSGFVSSDYTDYSDYKVTKLDLESPQKVDGMSRQWAKNLTGAEDMVAVRASGTIENDNFTSDFTGVVYLYKVDGRWAVFMDPAFDSSTTVPRKGVDSLITSDYDEESGADISTEGFSSTLSDGSNGSYSSKASGTVVDKYWFGTVKTKRESTFTFRDGTGWVLEDSNDGNPQATWDLDGKKLTCTGDESYGGKTDGYLAIGSVSGDNVTATYQVDFRADKDMDYKSVKFSGSLQGKISYDDKNRGFEMTLTDPKDKDIEFDCDSSIGKDSNGSIQTYDINADVSADKKYYENWMFDRDFDESLTFSMDASQDGDSAADASSSSTAQV